jgi:xanthine dehydrogenase YagT iron-sulfur-binding subunit
MNDSKGTARGGGMSRRAFLSGTGAVAAATALGQQAEPARKVAGGEGADAGAIASGPGSVQLKLNVNGAEMSTSVEPRVTLLDALRNYLDVTGCKRVCDRGTCGACTVMVDGKPVYSCSMLALEARGKSIKTAESLMGSDGKLDSVPAAFASCDAQQCGFCTPGFVVAMRAAFDKNPNANPAEIEVGLSGNICRCGTYEQMRDAVVQLCTKKGG